MNREEFAEKRRLMAEKSINELIELLSSEKSANKIFRRNVSA